jgi:RNA polymerase sigma-70 factor, ECF subfamily
MSSFSGAGSRAEAEADAVVAAARAGDESAFGLLVESYRRELQVHCYRMVGSFEDAEDMVQETYLRAWRSRSSFEGRSSFRAWLYRIATNACLDLLKRRRPRVLPPQVAAAADPRVPPLPTADLPWLQPYPDRLLEPVAADDAGPEAVLVEKETIELAFMVAIQHLPPRQRAVLILRDVLGWPAKETAALLDATVGAVNAALQRARATLKRHLPARRLDWASDSDPTEVERSLLQRYVDAHERADASALVELLREDARLTMPPTPTWYDGRAAIVTFHAEQLFGPDGYRWRFVRTAANRQPAVAFYTRAPGESGYRASVIDVLRIEGGVIGRIDAFVLPELFAAFGIPQTM